MTCGAADVSSANHSLTRARICAHSRHVNFPGQRTRARSCGQRRADDACTTIDAYAQPFRRARLDQTSSETLQRGDGGVPHTL
eukprot:6189527-Pleurochrysis_carterae.AAC.1